MGWGARISAMLLVFSTIFFVITGASQLMDSDRFIDPEGVSLNGKWDFKNAVSPDCVDARQPSGRAPCFAVEKELWPLTVEVPKPLDAQIKQPLAKEFWYRKKIYIPDKLLQMHEELSITLGSTKGAHEIWINGHYLASGEELSLANHPLPRFLLGSDGVAEVVVRVGLTETLFPGIVHLRPTMIGRTKYLSNQLEDFYFQISSKPLIPTIFKAVLFLTFMALFIAMPMRREYIYFSLYCFFGAAVSLCYWRYQPFYSDYFFRQQLIFIATLGSAACVPLFVIEFFRFNKSLCSTAAAFSTFIFFTPVTSLLWISDNAKRVTLYQWSYEMIPWVVYIPAIIFSVACSLFLLRNLHIKHRAFQGFLLAGCFLVSIVFGDFYFAKFFSFKVVLSPDLIDIGVFSALSFLMIGDFKSLNTIFQKSKGALPSFVSRLLSAGVRQAIVEFRAVTLVIDVVSYTKKLSHLSSNERDDYNTKIKEILSIITEEYGGEKISDTGDGGVYVWNILKEEEERDAIEKALLAAINISEKADNGMGVFFRMGAAMGEIKCHFNAPNYSFLGDPINIASRLEASAEIGQVLVHESISVSNLKMFIEEEMKTYQMKGGVFTARPITKKKNHLVIAA